MSVLTGTTIDHSVEDGSPKETKAADLILRSHSMKDGLLAGSPQEGPMQLYKAVRPARLYEQIVEQIERSIVEGKLKPGDQLPTERELAQQFGVSRTAVREAVKTLTEKGLVESHSGRGTFVQASLAQNARSSLEAFLKHGNHHDRTHLVELREIIEPQVTALAATRIEEQQLAMMRDAVAQMERSMRKPEAYIEADLDFHLALAEAAGNPLILSLLDSVVGMLREQRMGIFRVNGGPERGQIHHKRILEAIERRDATAARLAMQEHLKQIRQDSAASAPSTASGEATYPVQLT